MEVIGFMILLPFGFIFTVMFLVNTILWIVEAYKRGWQEIRAGL